jgi:hypothetical protein
MGITHVGDCLRLPREGFARRFGVARLLELDRALGRLPDPRQSFRAIERFCSEYELPEEESASDLLLNVCQELLIELERFLLIRQLSVQRVLFSFFHLREPATHLTLGSMQAGRSIEHWFDLLKIKFEALSLPAPVIAIRLLGGRSQALTARTSGARVSPSHISSNASVHVSVMIRYTVSRPSPNTARNMPGRLRIRQKPRIVLLFQYREDRCGCFPNRGRYRPIRDSLCIRVP